MGHKDNTDPKAVTPAPRILLVTTMASTIEAFLLPYADRLREKGWVVEGAANGLMPGSLVAARFDRVWNMPWDRRIGNLHQNLKGCQRIRVIMQSGGYDIVHVHTPIAASLTRLMSLTLRGDKRPCVIYTAHGFHFHRNGRWWSNLLYAFVEKIASYGSDAIITINQDDEKTARRMRLAKAKKIFYTPGIGIDLSLYKRERFSTADVLEWRRQEGIPIDAPLFVMVAEFEPGKRHVDAINALAICRLKNAHLAFAGNGRIMSAARTKVKELGLSGRCHFLGLRKDVPLIIASADAMLMPSEREGLPRSVMEAMAMRTPVIGADSRGIRDLLGNDCGLVHKVYEPKEIARLMELVISDKTLAARITENALIRVQECDLEKILGIHDAIYEELLSVTPGRSNGEKFVANATRRPRILGKKLRILVAGGNADSLINFRGHMLKALKSQGHTVIAVAPFATERISQQLRSWGVDFVPVNLERAGFNPWSDWRYLRNLASLVREREIDITIAYTHKPVIYGAIAAARASRPVSFYAIITGLGFAFMDDGGLKRLSANKILCWAYRKLGPHFSGIIFQNPDDENLFEELELVSAESKRCVVNGSGVDLDFFTETPVPSGPPRFLLIARLLKDKGIREYVEAARLVHEVHPEAEFHLAGPEDPNPSAIPLSEVKAWEREGDIIYHGACDDVRPHLNRCTVYVLPSYREGTPRTVLEAMATGRAVIATDAPGCRETIFDAAPPDADGVRNGRNGFLVPVKSIEALTAAMLRFIDDPSLAVRMGTEGRRLAEEHYNVHKVNREMMDFMGLSVKQSRPTTDY